MALLKNPNATKDLPGKTLLIEGCKILHGGELQERSLLLQNGVIAKIAANVSTPYDQRIQARNLIAIPGLVDCHVHLRDMELAHKETFITGTSAAAAGGVTTVIDMPNTVPPTDSKRRLQEKMDKAGKTSLVNIGFHAAATANETTIKELGETGAFSLKLYLPNPIAPLAVQDDKILSKLMWNAARNKLVLTVHAEDPTVISNGEKAQSFQQLATTRPHSAETRAVSRILRLQKLTKCFVHFCHLTLHSSVRTIRTMGRGGVSAEVTPHHILLSEKSLKDKEWKAWMVPPLRNEIERKKLFLATARGELMVIASDHAPHTVNEKRSSPLLSPPGVPGLETTLPLLLTLTNKGMVKLERMVNLTSLNPCRIFGMRSKGSLKAGKDADLVLVDMKKKARIDPATFYSKAKYSPFEGTRTQGAVHTTIVGGMIVYSDGQIVAKPGSGKVLAKT